MGDSSARRTLRRVQVYEEAATCPHTNQWSNGDGEGADVYCEDCGAHGTLHLPETLVIWEVG